MMTRFMKNGPVVLALAVVVSAALPAFAGDFSVGGRGFLRPSMNGMHFANRSVDFQRNFHPRDHNHFASGDRFRFQDHDFRHFDGNREFRGRNFARNGNNSFYGGNYFHSNRPQRLYSISGYGSNGGSSVNVISRNQPDYDVVSNYAGTSDAYQSNAGTYITGYGYSTGYEPAGASPRPLAKVIDVAHLPNACSMENGVCVIRP
jgi:hypothetical protein